MSSVCNRFNRHPTIPYACACGYPELWHYRQREGDQPLPVTGQQNVSEAVKADLDERIKLGIQRYGKPLQTFNGRDALRDAYEEALDLVHYLKQAIMERDRNQEITSKSEPNSPTVR